MIKKGWLFLSARAADRAADEVEVIEHSADASRPFVQGRRPFYKTEKSSGSGKALFFFPFYVFQSRWITIYMLPRMEKLEYRGYDSAGISILENGKIETIKTKAFLFSILCIPKQVDYNIHAASKNIMEIYEKID